MDDAARRGWVLLGAGGHASSVAAILLRRGERVVGWSGTGDTLAWLTGERFASDEQALDAAVAGSLAVALAVGDHAVRARMAEIAAIRGAELPPVVAASAVVSPGVTLGAGVLVAELAMIGPGVTVGAGAIVNTAAVVEHGARIGAGTHVAPRAVLLGDAAVGAGSLVAAAAVVLPGCSVGSRCTIGAGAVVTSDVPDDDIVIGVPARSTRYTEGGDG